MYLGLNSVGIAENDVLVLEQQTTLSSVPRTPISIWSSSTWAFTN